MKFQERKKVRAPSLRPSPDAEKWVNARRHVFDGQRYSTSTCQDGANNSVRRDICPPGRFGILLNGTCASQDENERDFWFRQIETIYYGHIDTYTRLDVNDMSSFRRLRRRDLRSGCFAIPHALFDSIIRVAPSFSSQVKF